MGKSKSYVPSQIQRAGSFDGSLNAFRTSLSALPDQFSGMEGRQTDIEHHSGNNKPPENAGIGQVPQDFDHESILRRDRQVPPLYAPRVADQDLWGPNGWHALSPRRAWFAAKDHALRGLRACHPSRNTTCRSCRWSCHAQSGGSRLPLGNRSISSRKVSLIRLNSSWHIFHLPVCCVSLFTSRPMESSFRKPGEPPGSRPCFAIRKRRS